MESFTIPITHNLKEIGPLLKLAAKQAKALQKTLTEIEKFDFQVSIGESLSTSPTVSGRDILLCTERAQRAGKELFS